MSYPTCLYCVSPGLRAIAMCFNCGHSAHVCERCYERCTTSDILAEASHWSREHVCRARNQLTPNERHIDALRQAKASFLEILMGANPTAGICRRMVGLIDAALEET